MRNILAGALALLMAGTAGAQTIDVHAGRVIDPASGRVLADQRIRIVAGKLASVAPWRDADGAAAVDWSGYTVLPGLIDLHTHLADGAIEENANDPAEPLKHSEAATILKGAAAARTELRSGFTTVRDVGVYRGLTDVALRDAINAGQVEGPRRLTLGREAARLRLFVGQLEGAREVVRRARRDDAERDARRRGGAGGGRDAPVAAGDHDALGAGIRRTVRLLDVEGLDLCAGASQAGDQALGVGSRA